MRNSNSLKDSSKRDTMRPPTPTTVAIGLSPVAKVSSPNSFCPSGEPLEIGRSLKRKFANGTSPLTPNKPELYESGNLENCPGQPGSVTQESGLEPPSLKQKGSIDVQEHKQIKSKLQTFGNYAYPNSPIASTPKPVKRQFDPKRPVGLSPPGNRAGKCSSLSTAFQQVAQTSDATTTRCNHPSLAQLVEPEEDANTIRDALFSPHLHAPTVHETSTNHVSNENHPKEATQNLPSLANLTPSAVQSQTMGSSEETIASNYQSKVLSADSFDYEDYDTLFIAQLPNYDHALMMQPSPMAIRLPKLESQTHLKTLVLDLDETLVHCSIEPTSSFDWTFTVGFNGTDYDVSVRKRPHVMAFLEKVSKLYEVVVFTASQRVYAEQVLDKMDPERKLIKHRLYRDSCLQVNGNFLKDLTVLGRDLRHTIIIDNSPHAFAYQLNNGIPIVSWFSEDTDDHLLQLLPLIEEIHSEKTQDVRPILRSLFRMEDRHRDIRIHYQQRMQAHAQITRHIRHVRQQQQFYQKSANQRENAAHQNHENHEDEPSI